MCTRGMFHKTNDFLFDNIPVLLKVLAYIIYYRDKTSSLKIIFKRKKKVLFISMMVSESQRIIKDLNYEADHLSTHVSC